VFQSTLNELKYSQDLEIKYIAAEKIIFLLNEQVEGIS
jgi:hypothetical protein